MKNFTAKQSGLRWLWLALLVFVLDISSKLLIMNIVEYGWENRIEVLAFFNLLYVHNYGAAFSFLSDAGGWQRWFFIAIALSISGVLVYWMRQIPASNKLLNIAYALVLGGAIGNLFNRLIHGYIVDFFDLFIGTSHWPAFNLADSAICVGVVLIVVESVFPSKKKASTTE
ncbi:signal peptidase II [Candidatus Enterovibrio altilux]|uniref:Lipoprotein signal peptidase n=1 Tax=Candidatus Enterovibrio altilux TaxID=1927128 RepID=A0A291B7H9_9GAMM|nr:signal peptidase II [Candidatus Enterovibrio luxaltus]ATF08950.1 Lipoprotein signal peptidase [Candidatus Enterovibrio luxaltus]